MSQSKPYLSLYTYNQNKQEIIHLSVNDKEQITVKGYEIWENLLPVIKEKATNHSLVINKNPRLEEPQIILLFLKSRDLAIPDFFDCLAQSKMIRPYVGPHQRNQKQDRIYHPVITISCVDIRHLHAEEKDDGRQREWNNTIYKTFTLDPRYKFLDSSIWHRYIPVIPYQNQFENVCSDVLSDIISYHQDGLYYTNAANINLEYQIRTLLNSYYIESGNRRHAEAIAPTLFHSEGKLKLKAKHELLTLVDKFTEMKHLVEDKSSEDIFDFINWNILILDDQAKTRISSISEINLTNITKEDLIKTPIKSLLEKIDINLQFDSNEKESGILEFADEMLSEKAYDLIFLDYLLGTELLSSERELGIKLFNMLKKDSTDSKKYKRKTLIEHWIFLISSFPNVFQESLKNFNISHQSDIWRISQISDPLSTPHHFTFTLYNFIKELIDKMSKKIDKKPGRDTEELYKNSKEFDFQIALSYASEDRTYVDRVAGELKKLEISCFYDSHERAKLWGKNLYEHLSDIYKNRCKYCVIFISYHYSKKLWTKHELKNAQARAFEENKEYILPARFDDTELPGILSTVAYLDCNELTPEELAEIIAQKLQQ